jgi:hypothetical protein
LQHCSREICFIASLFFVLLLHSISYILKNNHFDWLFHQLGQGSLLYHYAKLYLGSVLAPFSYSFCQDTYSVACFFKFVD